MANALARLEAPVGRGGTPLPAAFTPPHLIGALAIMTILAVGTGFSLAYLVQERIEAAQASAKAETSPPQPHDTTRFAGEISLERLSPIVTNLVEPADAWVRVDLSLVMDALADGERKRLASEIAADALAYLRTLTLAQIEGASGLQFLREDLSERAMTRSQGRVRELLIETLVVQ